MTSDYGLAHWDLPKHLKQIIKRRYSYTVTVLILKLNFCFTNLRLDLHVDVILMTEDSAV